MNLNNEFDNIVKSGAKVGLIFYNSKGDFIRKIKGGFYWLINERQFY